MTQTKAHEINPETYNYCLKQWLSFTTLTDEEFENLKCLYKSLKPEKKSGPKESYRVFDGKEWHYVKTMTECAKFAKVTLIAISHGLRTRDRHKTRTGYIIERLKNDSNK